MRTSRPAWAGAANLVGYLAGALLAPIVVQAHDLRPWLRGTILLAGAKNARLKLRALIAHLDTPLENGGDTQVVYLRTAKAKDLVPILQGVAATLTGIAPPTAADSAFRL